MSKLAKFFITCGAVCVLGIILTVAGFATGGVDNLEKVESSHSWFNVGPVDAETDVIEVGDYDSIKADGTLDVAVIGPNFVYGLDADFAGNWLTEEYREEFAGNVIVNWKKGTQMPEVKVEKGVLMIHSNAEAPEVEVNLSGDDSASDVIVFCSKEQLKNVDLGLDYGDIAVGGIGCDTMKVSVGAGDVELNGIKCGSMEVSSKTGDVEASDITGGKQVYNVKTGDIQLSNCTGDITAETVTGDIKFDAVEDMSKYEVSLHAGTGDVEVNDSDKEVQDFSAAGGPNKLACKTGTGDIEADFGVAVIED